MMILQGSAKRWYQGLVNFVTALAYHFCLTLPEAFTQPADHLLAEPCSCVGLLPTAHTAFRRACCCQNYETHSKDK